MYNILTLNAISPKGLDKLPGENFAVSGDILNPDGIIVRSADMHEYNFPDSLLCVARAGAGTNNIPLDKCAEKGIVVFNTPGANANAVKELVIAALLLASRKIVEASEWTKTLKGQPDMDKLVESGKKKFAGPEITGKKLGVLGLGAIGVLVANAALALGMEVIGYDPYLSVQSAWHISGQVELAKSIEEVVSQSDYVTIHTPLNDSTKGMVNAELLKKFKKGARLINIARGGLVDPVAVAEALDNGILAKYVADFAAEELLGKENVAVMAAQELKEYIEYGNIKNSVNFPNCEAPYTGKARVTIAHRNIPNMVGSITAIFAKENLNIDNMINKSRGDWAYTIIDFDSLGDKHDSLLNELKGLKGVVKPRIVRER